MKLFTRVVFGILVFAFLPVGSGYCEDFEITVTSFPDTIVLGMIAEFHITVQNTIGKDLKVPWDGNPVRVQIRDEFGNPAELLGEIDVLTVEKPRNWSGTRIEKEWKSTVLKEYTFVSPGKYTVQLLIDYHGPYVNGNGMTYEAWEGTVEKVLTLTVKQPEGVDHKVFDALSSNYLAFIAGPKGPSLILREYPTSTYASYLVWRIMARDRIRQDIETISKRMRFRTTPINRISSSVPCDKAKSECPENGWMRLQGHEYLEWRTRWLREAIQQHPEMWFTEENQLQLAIDLYMIGDQEAGLAELATLKETASAVAVKAKAREILKAIRADE